MVSGPLQPQETAHRWRGLARPGNPRLSFHRQRSERKANTHSLPGLRRYATLPWMYLASRFFPSADVAFISYVSLNFVFGLCTLLMTTMPRLLAIVSRAQVSELHWPQACPRTGGWPKLARLLFLPELSAHDDGRFCVSIREATPVRAHCAPPVHPCVLVKG